MPTVPLEPADLAVPRGEFDRYHRASPFAMSQRRPLQLHRPSTRPGDVKRCIVNR